MAVYNLLGQRIVTLAERQYAAGQHALIWNGRNEAGSLVPAGVYIVRMQTEKIVLSRKMLVLRE